MIYLLKRTFILDFVKQEFSTTGVVTRQGEKGEEIHFKPYAGGELLDVSPSNATAKLKGITSTNKYIEIDCVIEKPNVGESRIWAVTTQDWNSSAGAFKTCYLELKMRLGAIQTSTVNIDWFVLPEASVTDKDTAHYVDELQKVIDQLNETAQQYLQDLHNQMGEIEVGISDLNTKLDQATLQINNSIQSLKNQVAIINQQINNALAEFEKGNFYTKPEADTRFMLKGELPADIQKFKLTQDNGTYLDVPEGVTSFTQLANYTGYFYVSRATALTFTDQNLLPVIFQNSGLYVFMPVGAATNFYRYQEIRLNVTASTPMMAFRNVNGTSATEWRTVATDKDISKLNQDLTTTNNQVATNTSNIDTLQQHDKIYVYKEKGLPNYGTGWDGVNSPECRLEFKRVGNRVTMNARINISDLNKFLRGGTATMDQIYKIPVGFSMESSVPYYNTPITTGQWSFSTTAPLNYSGIVEQTGYVRWTTAKTGNHYLTATYFTEDPFPTEGALGGGQVKIMTQNPDGSIEFGGDW